MFGKARSKAELQQLKNEFLANLDVEIENANILEKKIRKPDDAPPVPPQYKTEADLRKDVQAIDNELMQSLMNEFGYGYSEVIEILGNLNIDDKIKLLALFPQFKSSLAKDGITKNLKLLEPPFINKRIKQWLLSLDKSFGTSNLAGIPSTIEELQQMMPTQEDIISILKTIDNENVRSLISNNVYNSINKYLRAYLGIFPDSQQINDFKTAGKLPNTARILLAQQLGGLLLVYKMITKDDIDSIKSEVAKMIQSGDDANIGSFIEGKLGGADVPNFKIFANNWKTTLYGADYIEPPEQIDMDTFDFGKFTDEQLESFQLKGYANQQAKGKQKGTRRARRQTDEESSVASSVKNDILDLATNAGDEESINIALNLNSALSARPNDALLLQEVESKLLNSEGYRNVNDILDPSIAQELLIRLNNEFNNNENIGISIEDDYENILEQQEALQNAEQIEVAQQVLDEIDEISDITEMDNLAIRIDIAKRKVNRMVDKFKGDNNNLVEQALSNASQLITTSAGSNALQEIRSDFTRQKQGEYSIGRKECKNLLNSIIDVVASNNKNYNPEDGTIIQTFKQGLKTMKGFGLAKGFHKMPNGKIMRDSEHANTLVKSSVSKLASMKKPTMKDAKKLANEAVSQLASGRISVKKLVGRGISVENQPTYKQFGKYVMHYPHLINNNVLNVKYPSLGSIPSIKPKTITDEYKDFILDIFDSGKMNERIFNTLEDDEKSHFHKMCKGAGLLELFKLKKNDTGEEKDDLDRFNLLKGSFGAGNNSESVMRELRGLITKFIHEGRITKNEGLSLLMEIK